MDGTTWVLHARTGRTGSVLSAEGRFAQVCFRYSVGVEDFYVEKIEIKDLSRLDDPTGLTLWESVAPGWQSVIVAAPGGDDVEVDHDNSTRVIRRDELALLDRMAKPDAFRSMRYLMTSQSGELKNRQQFRKWYRNQYRLSGGYPSFLTTVLRPSLHQLNILARVVNDPVRRYILADEVGLGKTVEAGLITRELLLEDPELSVRIFVPKTLQGQWSNELRIKLRLEDELNQTIHVNCYESLSEEPVEKIGLLIIDEAHRICEADEEDHQFFEQLKKYAENAESVLLLTATPYRTDSGTFLRLLHLVDPDSYPLDDVESFEIRLQQRVRQAELTTLLDDEQFGPDLLTAFLSEIVDSLPKDEQLLKILEQLKDDSIDDRIRKELASDAKLIIEERHRIGHRVIRTRRDAKSASRFRVRGRQYGERVLNDPLRSNLDQTFDQWRELAVDYQHPDAQTVFEDLLQGVLNGPKDLRQRLEARLVDLGCSAEPVFDSEPDLLRRWVSSTPENADKRRVELFIRLIERDVMTQNGPKLTIAAFSYESAKLIRDRLKMRFGSHRIAASIGLTNADEVFREIQRFDEDPECRVFVIDRLGEEGCNLQKARSIINFDNPLSFNRFEQRIGRVDRYSEGTFQKVSCEVLTEPGSAWVTDYQTFMRDTLQIFDRSIATLQRALREVLQKVLTNAFHHGSQGFLMNSEEIVALLNREDKHVARIERVESSESEGEFDSAAYSDLLDFDDEWTDSQGVIDAVTSRKNLNIRRRRVYTNRPIFSYKVPEPIMRSSMLGRPFRASVPQKATSNRLMCRRDSEIRLLRMGDPFVERMRQVIDLDQRGRFAVRCVYSPDQTNLRVWFEVETWTSYDIARAVVDDATRDAVDESGHISSETAERRRHSRYVNSIAAPRLRMLILDQNGNELTLSEEEREGEESSVVGRRIEQILDFVDVSQCAILLERRVSEILSKANRECADSLVSELERRTARRRKILEYRGNALAVAREEEDHRRLLKVFEKPQTQVESIRMFVRTGILLWS